MSLDLINPFEELVVFGKRYKVAEPVPSSSTVRAITPTGRHVSHANALSVTRRSRGGGSRTKLERYTASTSSGKKGVHVSKDVKRGLELVARRGPGTRTFAGNERRAATSRRRKIAAGIGVGSAAAGGGGTYAAREKFGKAGTGIGTVREVRGGTVALRGGMSRRKKGLIAAGAAGATAGAAGGGYAYNRRHVEKAGTGLATLSEVAGNAVASPTKKVGLLRNKKFLLGAGLATAAAGGAGTALGMSNSNSNQNNNTSKAFGIPFASGTTSAPKAMGGAVSAAPKPVKAPVPTKAPTSTLNSKIPAAASRGTRLPA